MKTLEKMARAMAHQWALADHEPEDAASIADRDWPEWVDVARAGVEAIRDPGAEAMGAGLDSWHWTLSLNAAWAGTISAILAEEA